MAIDIQQEQLGAMRILGLSGRLDTETAVDVELALQDLLGAGERQFLIDLAGIGYVSSAGLRVLLGLAKQLEGGKGTLRLCGLNASVRGRATRPMQTRRSCRIRKNSSWAGLTGRESMRPALRTKPSFAPEWRSTWNDKAMHCASRSPAIFALGEG